MNLPVSYSDVNYTKIITSYNKLATTAASGYHDLINNDFSTISTFDIGVGSWDGLYWFTIGY